MADLKALNTVLEGLGNSKPNAESRRKLEQGLLSKWDGVCVTAAKALCRWGDPESVAAVRDTLVNRSAKQLRWAAAGAMASAIAPKLGSNDIPWVVQLLVKDAHVDNVAALRPLLDGLEPQPFIEHLRAARSNSESNQRHTWLNFMEKYASNRSAASAA